MTIHILIYLLVILLRHYQPQCKIVKNTLNGIFPITLIILHTYQFTNEWNLFGSCTNSFQYLITNLSHTTGYIVLMLLQIAYGGHSFFYVATDFILTVLCLTLLFHKLPVNRHLQSIFLAFGGRTINFEYLYIRTLFHLHQLCQLIVFFGFGLAVITYPHSLIDFLFNFMYLLTHLVLLNSHRQAHLLLFQLTLLHLQLLQPIFQFPQVALAAHQLLVAQIHRSRSKPIGCHTLLLLHFIYAYVYLLQFLCQCIDRFQLGNLLLHLIDISLSLHQILEVVLQFLILLLSRQFLEHIRTNKTVQIVQHFHTHYLIEECKRLVRTHTEEGYHLFAICHRTIKKLYRAFCFIRIVFFRQSLAPIAMQVKL